jgi:hypothetical protein
MTSTDKLPDYNDETVDRMEVKFVGVGTGFTGLDVRPMPMELDEEAWFVMHVKASESASHKRDPKTGELIRIQRLHAEDMAPIGREIAGKALQQWAAEIERIKAEIEGQTSIDDELAAQEREAHDADAEPAEVAADAAARVRAGK